MSFAELKQEAERLTPTERRRLTAHLVALERKGDYALFETLELLNNPKAMRAIREAERGLGRSYPAEKLPE